MAGLTFVLVFEPQNHSKFVADTIGEHLRGSLDNQIIRLLQSFIYPKKWMIERPETLTTGDENPLSFTLTGDIQAESLHQPDAGKRRDPIFELFNPPADGREGKSSSSLES